jgi:hypothetical protein
MLFGCEVGVRKNVDRAHGLTTGPQTNPIKPTHHPATRQTNDATDTAGSTYASGDALPSRGKPSRECASIMGWQGAAHTREQG